MYLSRCIRGFLHMLHTCTCIYIGLWPHGNTSCLFLTCASLDAEAEGCPLFSKKNQRNHRTAGGRPRANGGRGRGTRARAGAGRARGARYGGARGRARRPAGHGGRARGELRRRPTSSGRELRAGAAAVDDDFEREDGDFEREQRRPTRSGRINSTSCGVQKIDLALIPC